MAETKFAKHTVTNTTPGPKILNTRNGGILLHAGETTEAIELSEAEFAVAKSTEWFDFPAAKPTKDAAKAD